MYNIVPGDGNTRNMRTNRSTLGALPPRYLGGAPMLGALPPWLQNAIQGALKGTSVNIGTPAGNKTFDLSDPKQVQQLVALVQSGKSSGLNVKFTGPGSAGAQDTGLIAAAKPLLIGAGILLALKMFL